MSIPSVADLPATIEIVKKSVVGVGTILPTRTPRGQLLGTGFIVADGQHVLTNAHVVSKMLDGQRKESLAVFIGRGAKPEIRTAEKVAEEVTEEVTEEVVEEASEEEAAEY